MDYPHCPPDHNIERNKMQVGNGWLKLNADGSCVEVHGITPAEAAILNTDHEANAKTPVAVFNVTLVGDEKRSNEEEINRLREKYRNAKDKKGESLAEKLYPGKNPVLPQKFEEVGVKVTDAVKAPEAPKVPAAQPKPPEAK